MTVTSRCLVKFFFLLDILFNVHSLAWTTKTIPSLYFSETSLRNGLSTLSAQHCESVTTMYMANGECADDSISTSRKNDFQGETSRRQWLASGVTAVAGTALLSSHSAPASAMDVLATVASCDPSVSVWKRDGQLVYLLGSAHISKQSAETAGQLVRDIHPDAVFVELDLKRVMGSTSMGSKLAAAANNEDASSSGVKVAILPPKGEDGAEAPSQPSRLILPQVSSADGVPGEQEGAVQPSKPKGGGFGFGGAAVGGAIRGMYKKLDSAGFDAGGEFVTAVNEGKKVGAAIVLGDQDVEITLNRLAMALKQTDLKKLLNPDNELEQSMRELMPSPEAQKGMLSGDAAFKDEMAAYVETMKAKENVRLIMAQLKLIAPALHQVMVTERDAYMAAGLNTLNDYECIVAVMGIAHVDGVENNLGMNGWKQVSLPCPAVA